MIRMSLIWANLNNLFFRDWAVCQLSLSIKPPWRALTAADTSLCQGYYTAESTRLICQPRDVACDARPAGECPYMSKQFWRLLFFEKKCFFVLLVSFFVTNPKLHPQIVSDTSLTRTAWLSVIFWLSACDTQGFASGQTDAWQQTTEKATCRGCYSGWPCDWSHFCRLALPPPRERDSTAKFLSPQVAITSLGQE